MENSHNTSLSKSFIEDLGKDTKTLTQKGQFYNFLLSGAYSVTMVTHTLGLEQKNLTRFKRDFEESGHLWVAFKDKCKVTGRTVQFVTTDPNLRPPNYYVQLSLFD